MSELNQVLQVRLSGVVKARVRSAAKLVNLKPAEWVRQVLLKELDGSRPTSSDAGLSAGVGGDEVAQLTVRLPQFIRLAVADRAASSGLRPGRWVAALVQSNVSSPPVLLEKELAGVLTSARELAAIGRNLNQIARALNEAHFQTERVRLEKLAELSDSIRVNRDAISVLVRASRNIWRTGE